MFACQGFIHNNKMALKSNYESLGHAPCMSDAEEERDSVPNVSQLIICTVLYVWRKGQNAVRFLIFLHAVYFFPCTEGCTCFLLTIGNGTDRAISPSCDVGRE